MNQTLNERIVIYAMQWTNNTTNQQKQNDN
jgi:hypothetical protein